MANQEFLAPKQAAELLGVSATTLWSLEQEHEDFPNPTRLSTRLVRYRRDALIEWMESRRGAS